MLDIVQDWIAYTHNSQHVIPCFVLSRLKHGCQNPSVLMSTLVVLHTKSLACMILRSHM